MDFNNRKMKNHPPYPGALAKARTISPREKASTMQHDYRICGTHAPKHLRMGTARMKEDKEIEEEGNKRGVSMEISKKGMKEKKSKYNNNKHNRLIFYKKGKNCNEIQLTKNKMDLN